MNAPSQQDLFAHVVAAYIQSPTGALDNAALYRALAERGTVDPAALSTRTPVGRSGQRHSLAARSVRWTQQSLKRLGVLERIADTRGLWRLVDRNKAGLHQARAGVQLVAFSTHLGVAVWGACESVLGGLDQTISLIISSPPYSLRKQRNYGNPSEKEFTSFICRALEPAIKHLAPGGSVEGIRTMTTPPASESNRSVSRSDRRPAIPGDHAERGGRPAAMGCCLTPCDRSVL